MQPTTLDPEVRGTLASKVHCNGNTLTSATTSTSITTITNSYKWKHPHISFQLPLLPPDITGNILIYYFYFYYHSYYFISLGKPSSFISNILVTSQYHWKHPNILLILLLPLLLIISLGTPSSFILTTLVTSQYHWKHPHPLLHCNYFISLGTPSYSTYTTTIFYSIPV